jgi:RNA polymerase-binding transcription factor DksA
MAAAKKTTSPAQATTTKATAKPAAKAAAKSTEKKATAPAKAPARPHGSFNEKFLEARHKQLLEERDNLMGSADRLQAEAAQLMEDQDPGDVQFDDESGEGDSLAVERERDLALSAQARDMITAIDAALERMKDGTYGHSLISGKPIPKERLEAIPWATELVEEKVGGLGLRR